jgi:hypothetical protein
MEKWIGGTMAWIENRILNKDRSRKSKTVGIDQKNPPNDFINLTQFPN